MNPDLERAEHAAYLDAFRASPDLAELAEIGGATCTALRRLPIRIFNRVVGLTSVEPLAEIAAFYGDTPWWVSDSHGLGPQLEERGFVRDYGWMKFSRGVGPREAHSDLHVRRVEPDRAGDFAGVVVGGYELPDWLHEMNVRVVGRPGWSCYVAYDGELPAGAGALFVHEPSRGRAAGLSPETLPTTKVGWLGFDATLAEFRGRGAQSAILAARIDDARSQGCTIVVTETGELENGRASGSYRNIVRAGFREAGVRPNYRAA